MKLRIGSVVVAFLALALSLAAQTVNNAAASSQVPPLIQFANVANDEGGNSLSGVVSITFSLYATQQGGEPLWAETQKNISLDPTGHYSVQLGITKPNGVPTTLFTSGEARWLGVRIAEQAEQPRVLLLSVPYALKAGDAATIGGLPPSAFVLATPLNGAAVNAAAAADGQSAPPAATDVTTTGGTANYLSLFNGTSTVIDSVAFQLGTGATAKIGINTTTPVSTLDVKGGGTIRGTLSLPTTGVATATAGKNSQPLNLVASAFNSTSSTAINQTFQWQAEPASNDTALPSGTLNLLFGIGATKPSETGLRIASNGQITFATGQTFPGAGGGSGTVTSVATGAGLTGGPITGTGTLSIATGGVTNAMLATSYAQLGAANTFTGNQTLKGTLSSSASSPSATVVEGTATSATGFTTGVLGVTESTSGTGVNGLSTAASGVTSGVAGGTNSPTGYGVYGSNSATTGNALGVFGATQSPIGYGVYGSTPGTNQNIFLGPAGVFGVTNAIGGAGVFGVTNSTATDGTASGVTGITFSQAGFGVQGANQATTGSAVGVLGTTASSSGYGVEGVGPDVGVYGTGAQGVVGVTSSVSGFGVQGAATSGSGSSIGVFGINDSPAGYGVYGVNNATGGSTAGVYGTTVSPSGYGVEGAGATGVLGTDTSATGTGIGLYGASPSGEAVYGQSTDGFGVYGTVEEGGYGVYGVTAGGTGVYGASTNAFGVYALSKSATALQAENDDDTGGFPTMVVRNDTTATHNPVFQTSSPNTYSNTRHCTIDTSANLTCTGLLTGSIQGDAGKQTAVYAMQSAENWLEDAGSGQLSNGSVRIELDPAFARTVNAGVEYHVFLTPKGDCKGLYVTNESPTGFGVRELGGGTSSIAFDYRIMAKRKGYENVRLEDLTDRFKQPEVPSQKMRRPLPPAEMRSVPRIATPAVMPLAAPRSIAPMPVQPKAVPLPHPTASKPEVTKK
jgi:hypothetical protein